MKPALQHTITPLLLAVAASTAPAQMAQQIQPSVAQGLFANWPLGITRTSAVSSPLGAPAIRAPGVANGTPVVWTAATFGPPGFQHPDYSTPALVYNWPDRNVTPEFGDTSTGGDVTPRVTDLGRLIAEPQHWYALTISVSGTARGQPGSLIATQQDPLANPARTAAGDLFSYCMDGSTGIDPVFVDKVRVEYTKEQLGDTTDIQGVDFGMGVISVDPGARIEALFPVKDRFYFTLTKAWLASPQGLQLTMLGGSPPNARTVYWMTWDGGAWSAPQVAYSPADLFGSQSDNPNLEIDAISVFQTSLHDRIVFSLTAASDYDSGGVLHPYDQILVYQRAVGAGAVLCPTTALTAPGTSTATTVSQKFGLRPRMVPTTTETGTPDEVDASCGLDPILIEQLLWLINPVVGLAIEPTSNLGSDLGISFARTSIPDPMYTGTGLAPIVDKIHLQVTGLAYEAHQFGVVQFFEDPAPHGVDDYEAKPVEVGLPHLITPNDLLLNRIEMSTQVSSQVGGTRTRMSARIYGVDFDPSGNLSVVELRRSWIVSFEF